MSDVTFDSYTSPEAEAMLRSAVRRREGLNADRRELVTESVGAAIVLATAAVIASAGHPVRHLDVTSLLATVAAFLVAARVRFPVGAGWNRPTQVAFVPMLFLLPITIVPFVVMACLLVDILPQAVRGQLSLVRPLTLIGDSAYSLGPVLVLLISGDQTFAWTHWPLYALAFGVQVGFDLGSGIGRTWFADRIMPAMQGGMAWSWITDACLSCAGLLIVASAVHMPGLVLLSIPLIAIFGLFARERAERMENTLALSTAYRGTALLLGDVIEEDDEYTGIHSRAVVDLALEVSDRLNLDAVTRRNVEFGALLHDVGKIRIPKEIIRKQGKLNDAEWALMREHTIFGEQMLQKVGGTLSSVGKVVRHSHERYDGTGYPDGLVGEQIPIEARVVCACDAFNAMTTTRAYRLARSVPEAIAELRRCSGTHFDPAVVGALLEILEARSAHLSGGHLSQLR